MENQTPRQSLVNKIFEGVADAYHTSFTRIYPVAAIWMERPYKTSREVKVRLKENDLIYVKDGKIEDCEGEPTHRIVRCEGTLGNNILYFILENLATGEIEKLNVNNP